MRTKTTPNKKTNDWPTQQQDMQAAEDIIAQYQEPDKDGPLTMLEITINEAKKDSITIEMSDWMIEVIDYFKYKYGRTKGPLIAAKVMTRFLLKDETIH